ncbi:MAG: FAD-dependent oxidoreductase [Parcubacteria group bacterium]|nr:FAD-dependent oxidoreductase [Parcubacteria group bacterium]
MNHYDIIIIGSGAAGLSAGLYAGRYGLKALIIGAELGGETARAGVIENWPGDIEVEGFKLIMRMRDHAEKNGAEIVAGEVKSAEKSRDNFVITLTNGDTHTGTALILAQGSNRRRLGLPNEEELTGKGVHYCVTCDGPVYTDKTIAVVGGGDASVKGINLAAQYAKKIYLIVRGSEIKAEPINRERMEKLGEQMEVLFETEVKEIVGENILDHVVLSKEYNGSTNLDIDGLFIEIGAVPDGEVANQLGVSLDEYGYTAADTMMVTNVPGVFVAGDMVNIFGHFKQVVTAAATGSVAATSAFEYVKKHK